MSEVDKRLEEYLTLLVPLARRVAIASRRAPNGAAIPDAFIQSLIATAISVGMAARRIPYSDAVAGSLFTDVMEAFNSLLDDEGSS